MAQVMQRFEAVFCDHTQMAPCCEPDCGHYSCPCGIYWDEGAEGGFFDEEAEIPATM